MKGGADKIFSEEFIEMAYFLLELSPSIPAMDLRVQLLAQANGAFAQISHLEGTLYYT